MDSLTIRASLDLDAIQAPGSYSPECLANASARAADRARAGAKPHPATSEADYTREEDAYLAAVGAYKARTGRKFLLCTEHLMILKSLGYSKAGSATPAP